MKKTMKRVMALMLAVVMAFLITTTAFPTESYAATKKKVTATSGDKPSKKSPSIKVGENVVTYKKAQGWVKFTATKKGKYTFTFSNLKSVGKNKTTNGYGYFVLNEKDGKYYWPITVKTNGGEKDSYLFVTTKVNYKKDKASGYADQDYYDYLAKRTATVSLKKGETIYIYSYTSMGSGKHSYDIKVKKK